MSKAILVIDMPNCCYECFAFDDSGDYSECLITKDFRGYRFNPREQKMYNCPLRPIPKKKDDALDIMHIEDSCINKGCNMCLHDILGELV